MTLPATNKFATKPGATAAKAPAAAKKKARTFGPATEAKPRDPMLPEGSYRVRILGCEELVHPVKFSKSFRFKIQNTDDGQEYAVLFMQTSAGVAEFQRLVLAAAGYNSVDEYSAFDPDGDFFEAVIGEANEFAARGCTIDRRLVDVRVTYGKAVIDKTTNEPTGDHYRSYRWAVVADAEQDEAGKVQ